MTSNFASTFPPLLPPSRLSAPRASLILLLPGLLSRCRVGERVGGFFTTSWGWHYRGGIGLDTASTCIRNAANHLQFSHPEIYFVTPDLSTTLVLEAHEAVLQACLRS